MQSLANGSSSGGLVKITTWEAARWLSRLKVLVAVPDILSSIPWWGFSTQWKDKQEPISAGYLLTSTRVLSYVSAPPPHWNILLPMTCYEWKVLYCVSQVSLPLAKLPNLGHPSCKEAGGGDRREGLWWRKESRKPRTAVEKVSLTVMVLVF